MAFKHLFGRHNSQAHKAARGANLSKRTNGFSLAQLRSQHERKVVIAATAAVLLGMLNIPLAPAALAAGDGSGNADLGIEKIWTGQSYGGGQWAVPDPPFTTIDPTQNTLSAIINFTNHGPDSTTMVTVTDPIPAGWTITEASVQGQGGDGSTGPVNGNQCTINAPTAQYPNGSVTCDIFAIGPWDPNVPIQPGFTAQIQLVGQVQPTDCTTATLTNTAWVNTGSTSDPNLLNNTSNAGTVNKGGCEADLEMVKSPDNQTVPPGGTASFTLTANNWGIGEAQNAVITDTLPAGLTPVTPLPSGCSAAGQTITCNVGTIPAPQTQTIWNPNTQQNETVVTAPASVSRTIQATLDPNVTGPVTNTATVGSDTPDPNPDNNTDTGIVTPEPPSADVALTKTGPATVLPNGQVTYTITVTNNGPSAADNVTVNDTIPSALTNVDLTPSVGTCDNAGTCQLGTLQPGATATITVTGTAPASGTFTNTAQVTTTTPGDDPGNNEDTVTTTVTPNADVSITKSVTSADGYSAGDQVTWTLIVVNHGPSPAENVNVTDTLDNPGIAHVDNVTLSPQQGSCTTGVSCDLGTLAPNQVVTITVTGTLSADLPAGVVVENHAHVSTTTDGDDPSNNDAEAQFTTQTPVADLQLTKTVTTPATPPVHPGEPIAWQLTATNNGPADAPGTTVTDTVPAGVTGVTATASDGGTCTVTGQQVTCTWPDAVPVGADRTVTISGTVDPSVAAGTLANTAVVSATPSDPNPDNNTGNTVTPVQPSADLQVVKSPDSQNVVPGQTAEWNLVVTNNGPSTAVNAVLGDVIPAGMTATLETPLGVCSQSGQNILCNLGSLAPGQSTTIHVVAQLDPSYSGTADLTNTATVGSPTPDPNPDNNTDTAIVVPQPPNAPVTVAKTGDATVTAGNHIAWQVTATNPGPSTATGVVLTDTVPDGVTNVTASVVGGGATATCAVSGNTVTCPIGDMPAGSTVAIAINGTVSPDTPAGTIVNTAGVTTTNPPGGVQPPDATWPTDVTQAVDLGIVKQVMTANEVDPGTTVNWALTVTNYGPSTATGVVISDHIDPSQATLVSATLTYPGYTTPCIVDAAAGTFTCPAIMMEPGVLDAAKVAITSVLSPTLPGGTVVTNTGIVTAPNDTNPYNNTDTADITVANQAADLQVQKQADPDNAEPGDEVTWTVTLENLGPNTAINPTLTDTLADAAQVTGLTVTNVESSDGPATNPTCSLVEPVETSGQVACSADSLSAGGVITVMLTGTLASNLTNGTQVDNTAVGHSDTPDPTPGNNEDNSTITVNVPPPPPPEEPEANMQVDKTASPETANPGDPVTWTVVLTNNGPDEAVNPHIVDTFADANQVTGVTVSSVTSSDADNSPSCTQPSAAVVDCTASTLSVGGTITVILSGTVAADLQDGVQISNTAAGSSDTPGTPDDDNAVVNIVVPEPPIPPDEPEANITVTKTADPTIAEPGDTVSWTVVLTNAGPSEAVNPVLTDTFGDASQVEGLTVSAVSSSDADNNPSCGAVAGGTVVCTASSLSVGGTITVTLTGTVAADVADGVQIPNRATGTSETPGKPGIDDGTVTVIVPPVVPDVVANIGIEKTANPQVVAPGDTITWTVVMTNNGPDAATNPVLTDTLANPSQVTDLAISSVTSSDADAGATCDAVVDGVVRCTADSLSVGGTITLTLTGKAAEGVLQDGATIPNHATGTSDTPGEPGEGEGNVTVVVPPVLPPPPAYANLEVTKVADPPSANPGDTVTWRVLLRNHGPSPAINPVLTDSFTDPTQVGDVAIQSVVSSDAGNNPTCSVSAADVASFAIVPLAERVVDVLEQLGVGNSADSEGVTDRSDVESDIDGDLADADDPAGEKADADDPSAEEASADADSDKADADVDDATAGDSDFDDGDGADDRDADGASGGASADDDADDDADDAKADDADSDEQDAEEPEAEPQLEFEESAVGFEVVFIPATLTYINVPSIVRPAFAPATFSLRTAVRTLFGTGETGDIFDVNDDAPFQGDDRGTDVELDKGTGQVGESVEAAGSTPATPVAASGPITCTADSLSVGGTIMVTFTGTISPDLEDGAQVENTAHGSSETPGTPGDGGAIVTVPRVPVPPEANLTVSKTSSPSHVLPGEPITWTVVLHNNGPDAAVNAVLTDTLGDDAAKVTDLAVASAISSDGGIPSCGIAGGVVTCTYPSIPAGGSITVTLTGVASEDIEDNTTITNSANGHSDTPGTPGEDNSTVTVVVPPATLPDLPLANLDITKEPNVESANQGDEVTWTVVLTNSGPGVAVNPTLTDTFAHPDQVTGLTVTDVTSSDEGNNPSCGDVVGNVVTCGAANLSVGGTITVTLTGTVAQVVPDGAHILNVAQGSADNAGRPGRDDAVVHVPRVPEHPRADLQIVKTADPTSANQGDQVTWTVVMSNNGPDPAVNPTFTDTFAHGAQIDGVTITSVTASDSGTDPQCGLVGVQSITCSASSLSVGGTITLTFTGTIADSVANHSQVLNIAVGSSDTPGTPGRGEAVVNVPKVVLPHADLSVVKTVSPSSADPGDLVTWTVVMTNDGPDTAVNPVLTDSLDDPSQVSGLTVVSVASSDAGNNPSCGSVVDGTVTCTATSLTDGGTITVVLTGTIAAGVPDGTQVANVATGSSETPGAPGEGGAIVTVPRTTPPESDLAVTKVADVASALPGAAVSWTITVVNNGPDTALNPRVVDTLVDASQATLKGATVTANRGAVAPVCTVSAGSVVCTAASLAAGGSVTIQVTGTLATGLAGGTEVGNVVVVSSATPDTDKPNNEDKAVITVVTPAVPPVPPPPAPPAPPALTPTGALEFGYLLAGLTSMLGGALWLGLRRRTAGRVSSIR